MKLTLNEAIKRFGSKEVVGVILSDKKYIYGLSILSFTPRKRGFIPKVKNERKTKV